MSGITAFIFHEEYLKYDFGVGHPLKTIREKYTLDLLQELEIFDNRAKYYKPNSATEDDLMLAHTQNYINFVKKKSEEGIGYLDYGDTPATKGCFESSAIRVGGSLYGAKLILHGKVDHAFNPGGGFHHARESRAAGFCIFNDIALTIRLLQKKYRLKRIAVVDIDGHHADGTQSIFYREPILKISLHRYDSFFYPGTGSLEEYGQGEGRGYNVNIPLPAGTDDNAYLYAFHEIVPPLIEWYEPEIILNQFGVDGHRDDPLVGFALTSKTYEQIANTVHKLAHQVSDGKYLIFGGGGYSPKTVARCWAIMFITVSEILPKDIVKYRNLFDNGETSVNQFIFDAVKYTVERIKKNIFPIHNITRS